MNNRIRYDYLVKLIVVGDSGVGKSSLMKRFVANEFIDSQPPTIGIDFAFTVIEINGKRIKVQIWDTAGQERFRTITNAYYRGAAGVIIVYDVSQSNTFDAISSYWLRTITENVGENCKKIIVGNKSDLDHEIETRDAQQFCKKNEVRFMEASAKTKENVDKVFTEFITEIYRDLFAEPVRPIEPNVDPSQKPVSNRMGCNC